MDDSELGHVGARVMAASRIAILGAGLNQQRTAHDAIHDLSASGWHPVPIHPSDAGAAVAGWPIRRRLADLDGPIEVIAVFVRPSILWDQLPLLVNRPELGPLIWIQPGGEDPELESVLESTGREVISGACLIRTAQANGWTGQGIERPPFGRLVGQTEPDGCSVFEWWTGPVNVDRPPGPLEWIGDIEDLKLGSATFPRYVRSLGPDMDGPAFIDHVRSLAGDVGQESVPSA